MNKNIIIINYNKIFDPYENPTLEGLTLGIQIRLEDLVNICKY